MTQVLLCPHCDEVIVKSLGPSNMKIRGKLLLVKNSQVYTVCKRCDRDVLIPLKVDDDMMKSLNGRVKLYVDK